MWNLECGHQKQEGSQGRMEQPGAVSCILLHAESKDPGSE